MQEAIEADGLVKSYPKGVTALDGLSFAVQTGTVFGLLGPNGAGKSTAVKILTTLALPDAGRASVAGIDVVAHPDQVRRAIGVVAQGSGVDVRATGRENLRLQGQLYSMRGPSLEQRASELLESFGLAGAADRIAGNYSGGMQRRLDIAMALVHDPQVLFLDEPTTGLDPEVRAEMWGEIARLAGDHGKTVLLTTHYLDEADMLASQLAIVDRGRVVASGTPEELKRELRGDAVEVELASEVGGLNGTLAGVAGIRDVVVDGRALRARADDGGRAVPAVLQALESHGIEVASVRIARPSLDDVYLRYTGRTFAAAEAEVSE
ncbi:MAG TPA: ATP-binding cassette domain-containing protein [Solirubrobacteraceae bacterium]|jgi:ABC-2 type transport system ATP-binding protein|nr:ATP-binding cassette domain-containing protein [Solirubrobacteraceae bacterium]